MPKFGRLQPVKLREVCPNEALDFTLWLAEKENLALLGEVLGMEFELEGQKINIGSFRADIWCKNEPVLPNRGESLADWVFCPHFPLCTLGKDSNSRA